MKMAKKQDKQVVFYNRLDIYKLLLNSKDDDVLKNYYDEVLGKLEKYDQENNTNLMEFLELYLKNNGNVQIVAEKQYIHRNTVNNQLKKIEKITNHNPLNLEEKLKFSLGFYIRDII
jgi:DNA-binding PucR family transcriptional regulator